jgi:hypothetical protein
MEGDGEDMTKLRPELSISTEPCMTNGTAYLMILSAVKDQPGLLHGTLHKFGEHCAIGSYFEVNRRTSLPEELIDEVAAVNDSVPHMTNRQRKLHVVRWLRWKLTQLVMAGFAGRRRVRRQERADEA